MPRAEFGIRRKGPRNAPAGSPRTLQSRGWRQGAQNKNASHDLSKVVIGRYEAFGLQLAERDMQCPLVRERPGQILGPSRWRPPVLAATPELTSIQHLTSIIPSSNVLHFFLHLDPE